MTRNRPGLTARLAGHVSCSPDGQAGLRGIITDGRMAGQVVGVRLDEEDVIGLLAGLANAGLGWGDVMSAIADKSVTGRAPAARTARSGPDRQLEALADTGRAALARYKRASRAAAGLTGGRA